VDKKNHRRKKKEKGTGVWGPREQNAVKSEKRRGKKGGDLGDYSTV